MKARTFLLFLLVVVVVVVVPALAASGCRGRNEAEGAAQGGEDCESPPAASALVVKAHRTDLVFRYYDSAARQMKTAGQLDAVPEDARARVIVFAEADLATYRAGQPLTVADLREERPDGTFASETVDPYQLESSLPKAPRPKKTPPRAGPGQGAPAPAGVGAGEVILFTAPGCPHCTRARSFFQKNKVRFTERDVEKDPQAGPLLAALGKSAGVDPALLTAVPIIWIKGQLLLGFDQARVKALL